ncbi:MAG: hypothetical protein NT120_02165 [Candidatus Aenigmarchaeota archaeon]|nr:hypothetical protein [Candidatus Aenigmarchaeota archaeon]
MRLAFASLIAFLFLVNFSLAFSVTNFDQTFTVPTTSTRQIDMAIISDTADRVSVNIIDLKSWVTLVTSQVTLEPQKPQTVSLIVSPFIDTQSGLYKVSLLFESLTTHELKKADIFLSVERREIVDIQKILVTGDLKPLGTANVELRIKNLKTVTVQNIQVNTVISSPTKNIATVNKVISRLDPGQETTISIPVLLDKQAESGYYSVNSELSDDNNVVKASQTFSVLSAAIMIKNEYQYPSIFGFKKTITITNYGNAVGNEIVTETIPVFDAAFLSGDKPTSSYQNINNWLITSIFPGESKSITYVINYTPFFFFVIAVLAAIWLFFVKLRTVRIRKYILHRKELEEGEEFTVAVEVRNALNRKIDTQIHDFVPAVFNVKDAQGFKATKKKSNVGTELSWHAKDLKQNEERVFTYKITPIFGIHGTIKLPRASVIFEVNKKKIENCSTSPLVGLPEERGDEEKTWLSFFKRK